MDERKPGGKILKVRIITDGPLVLQSVRDLRERLDRHFDKPEKDD
jgi:hypothetical protein